MSLTGSVSERTVRRYVRGVEPDIRMPSELDSNELTDGFYDQVLASRRRIVAIASEDWAEPVELGIEAVDSAMKSLRKLLAGMENVSIRKLGADESLRAEFFRDFMAHVLRDWIDVLRTEHLFRELGFPPAPEAIKPSPWFLRMPVLHGPPQVLGVT